MPVIGPSFPIDRPTMAKAKQVEAAANACPAVALFYSTHPNGFDPVDDLNAMHELEKFLDGEQAERYHAILSVYCGDIGKATEAPASERLDAWLHVRGLWVSDPPPPVSFSGEPTLKEDRT